MRRSRSQLDRVMNQPGTAPGLQNQMPGFAGGPEVDEIQQRLNSVYNQHASAHPNPPYADPAYHQPFAHAQPLHMPMQQQSPVMPAATSMARPAGIMNNTMQSGFPGQPGQHGTQHGVMNQGQLDTIKSALEQMSNKLHAINQSNTNRSAGDTAILQQSEILKQHHAQMSQDIQELKSTIANLPAMSASNSDLEIIRDTLNANYRAIMEQLERSPGQSIDSSVFSSALEASHKELSSQIADMKASIDATLSNPNIYAKTLEVSHEDITRRLDDMHNALQTTIAQPGLYVETVENNHRDLADQITLLQQSIAQIETGNAQSPEIDFSSIEMRLEEITRAVVALSLNDGSVNNLERIEARVSNMAKTLDKAIADNSNDNKGFEVLEARLNDISALLAAGSPQIGNVEAQIKLLTEKLENLSALSVSGGSDQGDNGALLHRMDELVEHISNAQSRPAEKSQDAEILRQLSQISGTIDQLATPSDTSATDSKFASIENQLIEIAQQLNSIPSSGSEISFEPLIDRLSGIEEQLGSSRDVTIELATKAAEDAVKMSMQAASQVAPTQGEANPAILESMSQALEQINRHAETSNSKNVEAFAAVSETLNIMVDRLGKIETGLAGVSLSKGNIAAGQTTHHVPVSAEPVVEKENTNTPRAETAKEAPVEKGAKKRNPVADLVRNARREKNLKSAELETKAQTLVQQDVNQSLPQETDNGPYQAQENELPQSQAPAMAMDALPEVPEKQSEQVAPEVALEPGSGGPDLASLVRQANERRKNTKSSDMDTAGTDFIAAARRAAQAAAQEAGEIEEQIEEKTSKSLLSSIPGLFAKRKKAILIGAVAILLAAIAVPLSGKFLGGDESKVATTQKVPAIEQVENTITNHGSETSPVLATRISDEEAPVTSGFISEEEDVSQVEETDIQGAEAKLPEIAKDKDTTETAVEPAETSLSVASVNLDENPAPAGFINTNGLDFAPQALKDAVAKGEPAALFEIGKRYTDAIGVEKDLSEAAKWYEKAADRGFAPAQYIIGNFNEKGFGVDKSPQKAAEWYEKAARGGNIIAMHNLAVLNATPQAISPEPNMQEAFKWFTNAADYGVRDSQVNAGIFYTKGFGTEVNLVEAYKWFAIAAKAGDKDAGNKRDVIANAMPPSQLEVAKALVKDWEPLEAVKAANEVTVNDAWKSPAAPVSALKVDRNIIAQTQSMLSKIGFDAGTADGIMGERTRNAITAFQQRAGLPVNGKIDAELLKALRAIAI